MASHAKHGFGWTSCCAKRTARRSHLWLLKRDTLEDIDIGFALLPEFLRAGICAGAGEPRYAMAGTAWHQARRGHHGPENTASIRLLEKLGSSSSGSSGSRRQTPS